MSDFSKGSRALANQFLTNYCAGMGMSVRVCVVLIMAKVRTLRDFGLFFSAMKPPFGAQDRLRPIH